jgi:hypothetical protein
MKQMIAVVLTVLLPTSAIAQAPPQRDVCSGEPTPDPEECAGLDEMIGNWPAFQRWAELAARRGDWVGAQWLGGFYEEPPLNQHVIRKDLVLAWAWFDIAATLHARKGEDNKREIDLRDEVGEHLSPTQKAQALRLEKDWWDGSPL